MDMRNIYRNSTKSLSIISIELSINIEYDRVVWFRFVEIAGESHLLSTVGMMRWKLILRVALLENALVASITANENVPFQIHLSKS